LQNILGEEKLKKKIKIFSIVAIAIMVLVATIIPLASAGADVSDVSYDEILDMTSKNYTTWVETSDASGQLKYNTSGMNFEFNFTASGLANDQYSLIYYTDIEDRFAADAWGGSNGIVIAEFSIETDGEEYNSGDMSVYLGMSMPNIYDANAYFYNYHDIDDPNYTGDNYPNAHGAKIWLVPTSALTNGKLPVQAWPPTGDWLFETDLINYTQEVSNPVGAITGDVKVALLGLSMTELPSTLYRSKPYDVTITATGSLYEVTTGVYGKITGWDKDNFSIVFTSYDGVDLAEPQVMGGDTDNCGFWNGDDYYFAPIGGDTYAISEVKEFGFVITPKAVCDFNIGIVLVSGIADNRD
jgi:hypothetical protein